MFKYLLLPLLLLSFQAQAATVDINWVYSGTDTIDSQLLNVLGDEFPLEADIRTYRLIDQGPGDYTISVQMCNVGGCTNSNIEQYTIPDVPNIDDIHITISVTKD